jgi:predicted permease
MVRDFQFALRALRRAPVYAAVSVLSLAVGIAANLVVFSVVNALLIRPLPVADPQRVVRIGRDRRDIAFGNLSFPEYLDLRDGAAAVADVVAHFPTNAIVATGERGRDPRDSWIELVSANYFSALRVPMLAGRGFLSADDSVLDPVVVLSESLWRARFGADRRIIDRAVRINGRAFVVVGVAPPGFHGTFAGFVIDAWVPARTQPITRPAPSGSLDRRDDRFLMLMARLKPGVSLARAQSTLDVLSARLRQAQRDTTPVRLRARPASGVHPVIAEIVAAFLGLLQGMVGLVLITACVNLANILLVRTEGRRRELAVRVALGASAWHVVRLVLAESLTIAVAGGSLGLLLAFAVDRLLERVDLPAGIPVSLQIGLDGHVIGVSVAITVVTALAFGLGPSVSAARGDPIAGLRGGGATADRRLGIVRNTLVAGQVAVATVLLVGSSLLLRSLQQTSRVDPGFDPHGVELYAGAPELLGYDEPRGRLLWNTIAERVARFPGVERASLALMVPLGNRGDQVAVGPAGGSGMTPLRPYNYVSPGYLETVRIPLEQGRDFRATDDRRSADVAIVNDAMAKTLPGGRAVGTQLRIVDREGRGRVATVIGVVGTVKVQTLGEAPRPAVYLPFNQWYRPDMVLHVRLRRTSESVTRRIVDEIHAIEPALAVTLESMDHSTSFALIPLQVAAAVLGVAGLVGLVLATIGVFGLVAYVVTQRKREIGLRMALGAWTAHVIRFVTLQGLRPVTVGLVFGVMIALGAGRLLRGLLVGVAPVDPVSFVGVCAILLASAAIALVAPTRRAVAVDVTEALRAE